MKKCILLYVASWVINSAGFAQVERDTIKGAHGSYHIYAVFPGGEKKWQEYLINNFRKKQVARNMPACDIGFSETAIVQFKILKNGTVAEVSCRNSYSISADLKREAVRVITDSPPWIPAEQNGRPINDYRIEKISITVSQLYL